MIIQCRKNVRLPVKLSVSLTGSIGLTVMLQCSMISLIIVPNEPRLVAYSSLVRWSVMTTVHYDDGPYRARPVTESAPTSYTAPPMAFRTYCPLPSEHFFRFFFDILGVAKCRRRVNFLLRVVDFPRGVRTMCEINLFRGTFAKTFAIAAYTA